MCWVWARRQSKRTIDRQVQLGRGWCIRFCVAVQDVVIVEERAVYAGSHVSCTVLEKQTKGREKSGQSYLQRRAFRVLRGMSAKVQFAARNVLLLARSVDFKSVATQRMLEANRAHSRGHSRSPIVSSVVVVRIVCENYRLSPDQPLFRISWSTKQYPMC